MPPELSRLTLGTAQLGMDYGIANTAGRLDYPAARDVLACALAGGITCLDTAASYGAAEEVVGRALSELGVADRVIVLTKVPPCPPSPVDAATFIAASVARSRARLRLDCLPFCLFHAAADACHLPSLQRLRDRGWLERVGLSAYRPAEVLPAITSGAVDAVQVPVSVVDRRCADSGVLSLARQRGVTGFARSVYLQGLLLMPEERIPPELTGVLPARRALWALAGEAGIPVGELALRYVLGVDGVASVVIGAESVEQVERNLAWARQGPLEAPLHHAAQALAPSLPESLLLPQFWPQSAVYR